VDSTQCAGGARPAKTERTKRRRLLSIEVRREVENNTGLGEAGTIDPTSKATIRGGKTYEEAIKHAEETLTLYLESFDELGKSILEERGLKTTHLPRGDSEDSCQRLIIFARLRGAILVAKRATMADAEMTLDRPVSSERHRVF
jgi:hypothetical protein